MKEIIKPQKYTSISYGVEKAENGKLLLVKDVIDLLKHILDDDDLVRERAEAFLNALNAEGE
jgi:hypothetical protein